ncbi:DUF3016 domain-containing protein [Photobacterium satsumensis]|uniref:DUF3016 domain-containing protein n=1 Tax=Photobacterium satsumensis TaxID=2910239 RepID=UPI003D139B46
MLKRLTVFPLLFLTSWSALAEQQFAYPQATIEWQGVDNYRDIKTVAQSQLRYEKHVLKALSDVFAKTAEQNLTHGQMLKVTVTDLDLAGEVRYRPQLARDMRVLTDTTPPRITFSYQVIQGDNVLKQGNEKISNLGYLSSVIGPSRDRPFAYEKQLITNWGKKTL